MLEKHRVMLSWFGYAIATFGLVYDFVITGHWSKLFVPLDIIWLVINVGWTLRLTRKV